MGSGSARPCSMARAPSKALRPTSTVIVFASINPRSISGSSRADASERADEVLRSWRNTGPIYVNGDVSKPGEYPYRPATTARQVIAVAGCYDIMHIRMNNPYLASADLRSEYASLWTEFAKEQAHMWRIKNELGDGSQISPRVLGDVPIAQSALSKIVNAETEYLKTKQSDYQREKPFLQRGVHRETTRSGCCQSSRRMRNRDFSQTSKNCRK